MVLSLTSCPNKDNKPDIMQKINELRGIGVSRTNALRQVHEQMPSKLILLNENQELLNQVNEQDKKQEKELKKEKTKKLAYEYFEEHNFDYKITLPALFLPFLISKSRNINFF